MHDSGLAPHKWKYQCPVLQGLSQALGFFIALLGADGSCHIQGGVIQALSWF